MIREIAGQRWFVEARSYPTAVMARAAWERAEAKLDMSAGDEGIGLYRVAPNPEGVLRSAETQAHGVIVVTLHEPTARKALRLLKGEPWEIVEGFADSLIARRARVVVEHAGETGRLKIRRPEGRGGQLDRAGRMREPGGQG